MKARPKYKFYFIMLVFAALFFYAAKNQAPKQTENCNISNDKFDCYEAYYTALAKSSGTKEAVMDLKSKYQDSDFIKAQCHQLMHAIGRAAAIDQKSVSKAFAQGDPFCWSGYYHGVMEGWLKKSDVKSIQENINDICKEIPGKERYSFDYYNCVHGLGHGIMFVHDNEVFDSLEVCNNLNGSYEQYSCWSGVFMENIITDYKSHTTKYLNPADPYYPCDAVDEKYKEACYILQTSYMLTMVSRNFSKVFELCSKAEPRHVDTCYTSIGRDASGSTISKPKETKDICMLGTSYRQQSNCLIGAVKDFISYFHSDAKAKEFCSLFGGDLQNLCFSTAKDYYGSFKAT